MHKKPLFVVNCKAYGEALGPSVVALARELAAVASAKGINLALAVPATEIRAVRAAVSVPVFAQHIDDVPLGAHTGWLPPEAAVIAGAEGTLLNHSEHRIAEHLEGHVAAARRAGLRTVVCAQDAMEVKVFRSLAADYIAMEPPELIGGDVSVSSARPELISACAALCPDRLLVGAGVKTRKDVEIAMSLGAVGVLIASGVVRAAKPKDAFNELAGGW